MYTKTLVLLSLCTFHLNGMLQLRAINQKIQDIEREMALIRETETEAVASMCCGSIAGIAHATGYNPCIPYSIASLLGVTAIVRCLQHPKSTCHAITFNELLVEHRRLIAQRDVILQNPTHHHKDHLQPYTPDRQPQISTLRKRTIYSEEV